jgi:hypothetical protein
MQSIARPIGSEPECRSVRAVCEEAASPPIAKFFVLSLFVCEPAQLLARLSAAFTGSTRMPLGTILLIILVLLLIGALPSWPYSAAWGAGPAGILGVVLVVVLIPVLAGRI